MTAKKSKKSQKTKPNQNSNEKNSQTKSQTHVTKNDDQIKSYLGNKLIVSVFLFLLSFAVFIPSLGNDFVWDDVSYIQKKAHKLNFSQIGPQLISPELQEGKTAGKYFRPLFQTTLILDNEIWNTSPFGFHLTNIVLHSISTVLLYFLILVLLREFNVRGRESIALIASTFFALYPLHVESVSFISARGDILAAIFFFLSFIFYIYSYKKLFYLFLAALCFFLSFLSKEVAVALPIVVLGFDILSRRLFSRTNLIKYSVLVLIGLFYFLLRSSSYLSFSQIINRNNAELSEGLFHIIDLLLNTYLFYFIKLVFLYSLSPFIDSLPSWGSLGFILSIIVIAGLLAAIYFSFKKRENLTAFSIVWILATLLPASILALLPIALTTHADRFLYIPSVSICILLAYIIYYLGKRFNMPIITLVLTLVISISFAAVTLNAQKVWKNNLSLWEYAVLKSPNSPGAKINYGDALRNSGRFSDALKQYISAYENSDKLKKRAKTTVSHGIAVSYIDLGDYQNAEKWLNITLNNDQKYLAQSYYLKGFINLRTNNPASARNYLLKSVEVKPLANAYYLLGGMSYLEGQDENSRSKYLEAEGYLNKALKRKPRFARADLLLAKVYIALGDKDKARLSAENAVKYTKDQSVLNEAQSILEIR